MRCVNLQGTQIVTLTPKIPQIVTLTRKIR